MVSFGQGCEGDPLLAAHVIEPAIRLIRAATADGTINMNTNGSRPEVLDRTLRRRPGQLPDQPQQLSRRPAIWPISGPEATRFADVLASIDLARERGKFVAVNYLNMAGFTDAPEEVEALCGALTGTRWT